MCDSDFEIKKYTPDLKNIWNEFVESSKNGTFLFNREYMDYHADRFVDNSFLIFKKGKLYCLLPANRKEETLYSHQGLTYGGLVMNEKCSVEGVLRAFDVLIEKLRQEGIKKFIYKPIPHIYHSIPSEEDLYALFRHDAKLTVRNISSTINIYSKIKFSTLRNRMVKKAQKYNLTISQSFDFDFFWAILKENLKTRYNAQPVHSLEEIQRLAQTFPDHIKLWTAIAPDLSGSSQTGKMLAGIVCYYTKTAIHVQYISATPEGKRSGGVDLIISHLIDKESENRRSIEWFDLGTSNEDGGRYLNESLIYQKQGFGGRAVCYDTYEIEI
ncbi:MAG: GNAT family N-acetyltransferase [Muribaculaceae bacterium]|nr:GNAT family N-acetyltransferase [Muribaculaceae bacterium]